MTIEKHAITSIRQWLGLRRQDLTASDLGAYLGLTPWKTEAQLYAEKIGLVTEQRETKAMRRGRRDEPSILAALKEERPSWVLKTAKVYLRDPELRLGCTPDAVAQDPEREGLGIVQLKSVASDVWLRGWQQGDRERAPEVPKAYQLQTVCEAMLAGASWAVIAAHVRSAWEEELYIIEVPRDAQLEESIRGLAKRFWADVEAGKMPQLDYKRDEQTAALFWPKEREEELDLTGDNELAVMFAAYCELRDEIAALEERKKEIGVMMRERLGEAAAARVAGGGLISWRTVQRPEHVVRAWSGRVLRVTAPREKAPAKREKEEEECA